MSTTVTITSADVLFTGEPKIEVAATDEVPELAAQNAHRAWQTMVKARQQAKKVATAPKSRDS